MANLTTKDKLFLEKLFQMGGGYVLDFSDRTMGEFFRDNLGIEIYVEEYNYGSGSKANRIRGFWNQADDKLVGKSIIELIDYIRSKIMLDELQAEYFKEGLIKEALLISDRLCASTNQVADDSKYQASVKAFLDEDFENINKSIEKLEPDIKSVIKQRIDEISSIINIAPLASIFLIASTLEGILLDVAGKHTADFIQSKAAPKVDGKATNIMTWKLNDLINVAFELGYLTRNIKDFSHSLREFRNYIHPRQQAMQKFNPNSDTSKICFQVLKAAITELDAKTYLI